MQTKGSVFSNLVASPLVVLQSLCLNPHQDVNAVFGGEDAHRVLVDEAQKLEIFRKADDISLYLLSPEAIPLHLDASA